MRFYKRFLLVLVAVFVFGVVFAQDDSTTAEEPAPVPDSVPMTLGVKGQENVMPEGFRGSDPDSGDIHWLEDVGYLMQENSDLYNIDAAAIAESAKFETEPNITWEIKKDDGEGNMVTESADNTNKATEDCNITSPGFYEVHNGGARQVSTSGGAVEDGSASGGETSGSGSDGSGSGSGSDSDSGSEGGEAAGGEVKDVTAQQRVGIHVHDCTSPDIWVAFQEGAGKVDMAQTEEELKAKMAEKIVENLGRPFSTKAEDYDEASYIFLDEGSEDERDSIPWEKSARLSIAGPLFNERGAPKFESGRLPAKIDEKDYKNAVNVIGGEGKSLKGVFVRRNVPFIFAAMATDNGNKRASAGLAEARIEYADGSEVEKDGDGYIFRIPNFPRDKYSDQPEYFFTAFSADKDGNSTSIRMPLYVVDTQASFEGGRNQ
ncbi:MAG: hypothetical protein PWR01_2304 [Clostridiales bacterium]|nr:hypothetical protein [Clostridiales bacterium]MDN5281231.1 hypothetical protein [Candidatus Ozemobacter sp.]